MTTTVFADYRCPKCGCTLLTNGRTIWCSFIGGGNEKPCRFRRQVVPKMQLELSTYGAPNGTALIFWDYQEGQDRLFILNADGTAQEGNGEGEPGETINLVIELRKMLLGEEQS